jgi:dienelactone hydrolase
MPSQDSDRPQNGVSARRLRQEIDLSIARAGLALLVLTFALAHETLRAAPAAEPVNLNTPREFPKITLRAEWETRAKEIREQVLVSCGLWPMPEKTPLHQHIFGKVERDGYSVEKVYFQPLPGFYLGGNLYRPLGRGPGPFPGVLNPHGHWKEGRLADAKEGSIPARCITFARQGMVAFSYDMVGYNDTRMRGPQTDKPHYDVHRQFGTNRTDQLWNVSLMGLQTWDSIRALDFLASLPDVDPKRLACTGESGGGTQTYMLGAVDDRLAAQAPVVMVSHTMQGGCSCENAPGLRVQYYNVEIAATAAPRPQILVAATGDWTKATLTVEGPAIRHIYELFQKPQNFRAVRFDYNHNYNQTSREAVYDAFDHWLLKNPDPALLKEPPYIKEADEALRVFPKDSFPADALTRDQLIQAMIDRTKAQWQALQGGGKRGLENYKRVMLPAWKHSLQLEWPMKGPEFSSPGPGKSDEYVLDASSSAPGVNVKCYHPAKPSSRFAVLVSAGGGPAAGAPSPALFLDHGYSVLLINGFSTGTTADPFADFFTTYNRTEAQERVRDLVRVCAFARGHLKARQVVLFGKGRAGLWAMLAAPASDAVIADCDQLDVSTDASLLARDLFFPGARSLGGFEGAALMAAPHPLLLQNAGTKFSTDALRSGYQNVGAQAKLRIASEKMTDEDLAKWIAGLK